MGVCCSWFAFLAIFVSLTRCVLLVFSLPVKKVHVPLSVHIYVVFGTNLCALCMSSSVLC
jgi:hypothetical protein